MTGNLTINFSFMNMCLLIPFVPTERALEHLSAYYYYAADFMTCKPPFQQLKEERTGIN